MEQIFEKSRQLLSARQEYFKRLEEKVEKTKEEVELERIKDLEESFKHPIMNEEQLREFESNLEAEFIQSEKEGGYKSPFDDLPRCNYPRRRRNSGEGNNDKDKYQFPEGNTAEQNYRRAYQICLEMANEHGFTVHWVKTNPKGFSNRNHSSICDSTWTFMFYCTKNNWRFTMSWIDDCECNPGILIIENLENNQKTEKLKDIRICDLLCQNSCEDKKKNFLMLLECDNWEEYYIRRFGPHLKLQDELKKKGYKVQTNGNISEKFYINPMTSVRKRLNYTLEDNGILVNLEFGSLWRGEDYGFYVKQLFPGKEKPDIFRMSFEELDNLDEEEFQDFSRMSEFIPLCVDEDTGYFMDSLENYFNMIKGEWGYVEDGKYHNSEDFIKYLKERFNSQIMTSFHGDRNFGRFIRGGKVWNDVKSPNRLSCEISYSVTSGQKIKALAELRLGEEHDLTFGDYEEVEEVKVDEPHLPMERHMVEFEYDETKDRENCYLSIDSEYRILSVLNSDSDPYYNPFFGGNNPYQNYKFRIGGYNETGPFAQIFDQFTYFIDQLATINGNTKD